MLAPGGTLGVVDFHLPQHGGWSNRFWRAWFGHDAVKWEEFRRRYTAELDAHPDAWQPLVDAAAQADVTLVYSSRDREHNNAVVLRDYLLARLRDD